MDELVVREPSVRNGRQTVLREDAILLKCSESFDPEGGIASIANSGAVFAVAMVRARFVADGDTRIVHTRRHQFRLPFEFVYVVCARRDVVQIDAVLNNLSIEIRNHVTATQ
jgi:hypothetical protein